MMARLSRGIVGGAVGELDYDPVELVINRPAALEDPLDVRPDLARISRLRVALDGEPQLGELVGARARRMFSGNRARRPTRSGIRSSMSGRIREDGLVRRSLVVRRLGGLAVLVWLR